MGVALGILVVAQAGESTQASVRRGMHWMDRLLNLTEISLTDPQAAVGWQFPLPIWVWALVVAVAVAAGLGSYRRLLGSPIWRMGLGGVRALLIVLLAMLLAGPMLVLPQEHVEQDWLLVLVDRSSSMQIQDMPADEPSGLMLSRDEAFAQALAAHADLFGPQQLGRDRQVLWLGFDSESWQLGSASADQDAKDDREHSGAIPDLGDAQGGRTAIRTAVEQALQRAAGRPISGLVLVSDGRSHQSTGQDLVRRLGQQAVSVFSVPLGTGQVPLDLAIAQVDAPDRAYVGDMVPVTVWLDRYPADAVIEPGQVRVRLVDTATADILDEQTASDGELSEPVRLSAASDAVGEVTWRVEVRHEAGDDAPVSLGEVIFENNQQDVTLELIDQPLRVLYVEGYPRWEYRYLKNMLVREQSMESSMVLISADRSFVQEGDIPITRVPNRPEELEPYDVIVLGDVPSSYFSSQQLTLIRDQVAQHGAGLLIIGGGASMPSSYEATPLAGLLPMLRPSGVERIDPGVGAISLRPTTAAQWVNVLALRQPGESSDRGPWWPDELPSLLWAQDLGELKPTAEVLATGYGPHGTLGPMVVHLRYGAGQTIYVATDETWRWRYGRGDLYYQQFWTQLIRMLGRSRLQQGDQRIRLMVSNRRPAVQQAVVVSVQITDPLLLERHLPRIRLAVMQEDQQVQQLDLLPVTPRIGEPADSPGSGRTYQVVWQPAMAGALTLRVAEPALDDLNITQPVTVTQVDDELRQPLPDRDRLVRLADQTGGAVVELDELDKLANLVPNRARRTPNDIREPLWNSYLALWLVVGLLTAEWVGRKVIRLA